MRLILFTLIFFHTFVFAQDDVSSSYFYIELENKIYTLDEIKTKNDQNLFLPLKKDYSSFGFTNNIFWVKVHLKNNTSKKKKQVLELKYPSLDYIDIYLLEKKNLSLQKKLGDLRIHHKSTFMPNPKYIFSLLPFQEKIFFIKIISTGVLNIGVSVEDFDAYNLSSSTQIKWLSFYFGAVFIMLIYNFIIYFFTKNKSFLYYVLSHLSYALFALGFTGIAPELFWSKIPQINQYWLPATMSLSLAYALLFLLYFLNIKDTSIKLYKFLYVLVVLSFLLALSPFVMHYSLSIQLTSFVSFFSVIIVCIVAIYLTFFKKDKNALVYLISWSFFLIGVAIGHLSNLGFLPSTLLISFSSQIGSFFELLLLSVGLAYYYNKLKKTHIELIYTNEILRTLSNTDMLTKSYNRRYFYKTVKHYFSSLKNQKKEVALLMLDLDFFKKVNDVYGHDIGDKVLIKFSETCQGILRKNDIFARFGGEEFVLFLPDTSKITAIKIAKRINIAVADIRLDTVPDLRITVSIGIAHNIFDIEKLLHHADKALYKAKSSGRDTFVFL